MRNVKIIEDRIAQYYPHNKGDEINAFKEISQDIALLALSRAGFFKLGGFQGGTCLRIIYGLSRFSEDLDFILYKPNMNFEWGAFIREIGMEFESYGLSLEVLDRSKASNSIKKAFLKQNSFGKVLNLKYERNAADKQTVTIKLEVDSHPPLGSKFESKLLDFPVPFSVMAQSIESLFAGKMHALLCRTYVKGRDWYDFIWYVTRKTNLNLPLLANALCQQGPWQQQTLTVNKQWVIDGLKKKVECIDWAQAKKDIMPFIKQREFDSIEQWNKNFFQHFVKKLEEYW